MQPVFDGHNDVLLRLWRNAQSGGDPVAEFRDGVASGHIDLPRARKGGLAGGLCAIYIPNSGEMRLKEADASGHYATPLAEPIERQPSMDVALGMALEFTFRRIHTVGGRPNYFWKCRPRGEAA